MQIIISFPEAFCAFGWAGAVVWVEVKVVGLDSKSETFGMILNLLVSWVSVSFCAINGTKASTEVFSVSSPFWDNVWKSEGVLVVPLVGGVCVETAGLACIGSTFFPF